MNGLDLQAIVENLGKHWRNKVYQDASFDATDSSLGGQVADFPLLAADYPSSKITWRRAWVIHMTVYMLMFAPEEGI